MGEVSGHHGQYFRAPRVKLQDTAGSTLRTPRAKLQDTTGESVFCYEVSGCSWRVKGALEVVKMGRGQGTGGRNNLQSKGRQMKYLA